MDNFEILETIGEGTYSTVYQVRRIADNQIYALKKVKIESLSTKEKENSLNEVRILASVNSPYVISYKESFIDEMDQTLCIVMEFADDGDLFQKITFYEKNNLFFEEDEAWKLFIQITKGLRDLHEYNILHRDMKSANVFMFKNGIVKLGDLNVSKIAARGLGCTQTGTPFYASPEVWRDNPYNYKSDIWSLGCVFYEILMLKTPFRSGSMDGLYDKVIEGKFPKISKKYSEKFSDVIKRILVVKADERPSAKDILEFPEMKEKMEEFNMINDDFVNNNIYINNNSYYLDNSNVANKSSSIYSISRIQSGSLSPEPRMNHRRMNHINNSQSFGENSALSKKNVKKNVLITAVDKVNKNKLTNSTNVANIDNILNNNCFVEPKETIINVLQKNLDYFNQLKNKDQKIVLSTIRMPNKLSYLNNNKLPKSRYEYRNINDKFLLTDHGMTTLKKLPQLNIKFFSDRNNNNNKGILYTEVNKNEDKKDKNDKNDLINKVQKNNIKILSTVNMEIDRKKPLNYKGKINIIVEEKNNENNYLKEKNKSISMMKDLKKIYQSYCPKIFNNEEPLIKYNFSEESIFGNLHYSMNRDLLKRNIKNMNLNVPLGNNSFKEYKKGPIRLLPILKFKKNQ